MPEETDRSEELKRLIDSQLLNSPPDCVHNFFNGLISICKSSGIEFNYPAALEYWWHLARIGVVAVPGGKLQLLMSGQHPEVVVTERGRKLLETGERSPHDPEKYILALKRLVHEPDAIALSYLDEAVGAWSAGLYRSSAVMLGCACERLVILLAEAFSKVGGPQATKVSKLAANIPSKISALFDAISNALMNLNGPQKLPGNLRDALDRKLLPVFEHARGLRNKSGHPTTAEVSDQDAEAGLLLFPGFCDIIYKFIEHLNGISAQGD